MEGRSSPYSVDELDVLARHCTEEEDAARKVERRVGKSAAALLLESRIGEEFDSIVTGAASKGTWVRLLTMPIEGKLVEGFQGIDVGKRIRVKLISIDVEAGIYRLQESQPIETLMCFTAGENGFRSGRPAWRRLPYNFN